MAWANDRFKRSDAIEWRHSERRRGWAPRHLHIRITEDCNAWLLIQDGLHHREHPSDEARTRILTSDRSAKV